MWMCHVAEVTQGGEPARYCQPFPCSSRWKQSPQLQTVAPGSVGWGSVTQTPNCRNIVRLIHQESPCPPAPVSQPTLGSSLDSTSFTSVLLRLQIKIRTVAKNFGTSHRIMTGDLLQQLFLISIPASSVDQLSPFLNSEMPAPFLDSLVHLNVP